MYRSARALLEGRLAGILVFLATLALALSVACILPGQQPGDDDTSGDDDDDDTGDDDTGDDDTGDDDTGDDDTGDDDTGDDDTGDDDTGDDDTGDDDTGDDDTTESPCSAGEEVHQGCGPISFEGCCDGEELLWCENNWLCRLDCSSNPSCGWQVNYDYYDCGTDGEPAPNDTPPMQCP